MIKILYDISDKHQSWFNGFYLAFLSISKIFNKNNIKCDIIKNTEYNFNPDDIIILFTPWFKYINKIQRFILFNSESMHVKHNFNLINYFYKKNIIFWLDYSIRNINLLLNYNTDKIHHLPICYSYIFENIIPNTTYKPIDVLFYGFINERRSAIIKELKKKNLKVHMRPFFDTKDDLHEYISRSKIILIIHYYPESFCINHYRINILLSNKVFIIHEAIDDEENFSDYNENIIFCKYNKIVKNCIKYLNLDQKDRDFISNNNYIWYKNKQSIEKYFPLEKILKKINI